MGYCNKAIHRYFKVIKMTWDHGFAVVGDDRIQKSMKIISCIEYVTKEELKGKKILEIGGGAGLISSAMSKYGNEVITIDVHDVIMQETLDLYKNQLILNFLIADGIKLPFKSSSFDAIVCNQVIEHIPKQNHQQLIDESYRALKPGGIFYIATPNKLWLIEPHTRLPMLSYLPKKWADAYVRWIKNMPQFNVYLLTYNELRRTVSSRFRPVINLTPLILKYPENFHINAEIPWLLKPFLKMLPINALKFINSFVPSYISIAKK